MAWQMFVKVVSGCKADVGSSAGDEVPDAFSSFNLTALY